MAAAAEGGSTAAQSLQQALPDLVRTFVRPLKHSKITEEVHHPFLVLLPKAQHYRIDNDDVVAYRTHSRRSSDA
jgi:hypothetical protein